MAWSAAFTLTYVGFLGFPGGSDGKESVCNARDPGLIPESGNPLEKGMATHSSILDWRISWTEESGGPQSMGSQRVGHDWVTNTVLHPIPRHKWEQRPSFDQLSYGTVSCKAITRSRVLTWQGWTKQNPSVRKTTDLWGRRCRLQEFELWTILPYFFQGRMHISGCVHKREEEAEHKLMLFELADQDINKLRPSPALSYVSQNTHFRSNFLCWVSVTCN